MKAELSADGAFERLPAAAAFLAPRLAIGALVIPIVWLSFGPLAGETIAAAVAAGAVLFVPRALVLDAQGFRQLSLVPRRKVLWSGVDSFNTGSAPRFGAFVLYTKAGRRPRWWYPAGWPAQGGIPPAFAPRPGVRALSASDLCGLLNDRLAKARSV